MAYREDPAVIAARVCRFIERANYSVNAVRNDPTPDTYTYAILACKMARYNIKLALDAGVANAGIANANAYNIQNYYTQLIDEFLANIN